MDNWNGRWLIWSWHRPEKDGETGYWRLHYIWRAVDHYEAALLARDTRGLTPSYTTDIFCMVQPLPGGELTNELTPIANLENSVPPPLWFKFRQVNQGNQQCSVIPEQVTEKYFSEHIAQQTKPASVK